MDTQRLSQTVQPLLGWYRAHARAALARRP